MSLTVSDTADRLVRTLIEQAALSPYAGLRIVQRPDTQSLSMGLADFQEPDDAVVARDDALLFISPAVADRTQGMSLCAESTSSRSAFFLEAA